MDYRVNEPVAALRAVPVVLEDNTGAGVTGQAGVATILVSKNGGAFAAPGGATALTAITGGTPGAYLLSFDIADFSTEGVLLFQITNTGVIRPYVDGIAIEANTRKSLFYGLAQTGSGASSLVLPSTASSSNNYYASANQGCVVCVREGTGAGQCTFGTGYTGSTKTLAMSPALTTPLDTTSVVELLPFTGQIPANVQAAIANAVWTALLPGTYTAGSFGELLQVCAGLGAKNNVRIDNTSFGSNSLMTACRIRVFATPSAEAAATDGHPSAPSGGNDGEIMGWLITATDAGAGTWTDFKCSRYL